MSPYKVETAINEDWLESHKRHSDVLHRELMELNLILFFLEKIEAFPFALFNSGDGVFWHVTRDALADEAILVAWRIVVDPHKDTLTLRQFKNEVFQHLQDGAVTQYLESACQQVDFDKRIAGLQKKIKDARNNYIAHLNRNRQINPEKFSPLGISLQEMKDFLSASSQLLDTVGFSHFYLWEPYDPADLERDDTDIGRALENVAKHSYLLNLPELNSLAWERHHQQLPEKDIEIINKYRRKFGLDEV